MARINATPQEYIDCIHKHGETKTAQQIANLINKTPSYVQRLARQQKVRLFRGTPVVSVENQMAQLLYDAGFRAVDIYNLSFQHLSYQGFIKRVKPKEAYY